MKQLINTTLIIIISLISIKASAFGADIAKIGVVDFQRVLKESDAGKVAAKKLREKQQERTIALKEKQKEIITLQKKIEGIEYIDDKEGREEKQVELNNRIKAFKKLEKEFSNSLKDINTSASAVIRENVNKLIVKTGKKGGYLLIVEKRDVLYSPDAVDITSMVIREYNKAYNGR